MGKIKWWMVCLLAFTGVCLGGGNAFADRTFSDARGRSLVLPDKVDRMICSGPGCLRLATYLNAQDKVVAVDNIEGRKRVFDARPYALANPGYKELPVFGGFRGQDDPEKILGLDPMPQVIFKTYPELGHDPDELQAKTDIPVVILDYGDLGRNRSKLFAAMTLMGRVLGPAAEARAKQVVGFFSREIKDLETRTRDVDHKKRCFVGGIAFKGPHGFQSTEPFYPPFQLVNAVNIAGQGLPAGREIRHAIFSKEMLLTADPEVLFLDLSTLQMGEGHGGLAELKTDPVYQALTAVDKGEVFGLLPYNWYTRNFGSVLADAWYIGTVLYPEKFSGIDPRAKADAIYTFLLGVPVFETMNKGFGRMAFTRIRLKE